MVSRRTPAVCFAALALVLFSGRRLLGQETTVAALTVPVLPEPSRDAEQASTRVAAVPPVLTREEILEEATRAPDFKVGGYVETGYTWNFARPSNNLTPLRGFDARHNEFALLNAALDVQLDTGHVVGRITLQSGSIAAASYAGEQLTGAALGGAGADPSVWRHIQQAFAGFRATPDLTISAGLFLSPIGIESIAARDNWTWSRSTLFLMLPFYHLGARASWQVAPHWTLAGGIYNGWNAMTDVNGGKSLSAQLQYAAENWTVSALYFGGPERARGAAEGQPWRHLGDVYATFSPSEQLRLQAHLNGGVESSTTGTASWYGAAAYARLALGHSFATAMRVEFMRESVPAGGAAIFFGDATVGSATLTLEYKPFDTVAVRLEGRHDRASRDFFFGGNVAGNGLDDPFSANRATQTTLGFGVVAWF